MNTESFSTGVELASQLGNLLAERQWTIATAESCTGGLIAAVLTEVPGSSAWFERGIVSYANSAKINLLGVHPATLETQGAVSEQTVLEMASGAMVRAGAQVAVSVSGVAGPSGGSKDKPVGTVWIGYKLIDGGESAERHVFSGSRSDVRAATLLEVLRGTISRVKSA